MGKQRGPVGPSRGTADPPQQTDELGSDAQKLSLLPGKIIKKPGSCLGGFAYLLRPAPPRCGPASRSEAWGWVLMSSRPCGSGTGHGGAGGSPAAGLCRLSTGWAHHRPSPGARWWGRRCPPGSRGPAGPGTCGSVSSAHTARAPLPGTCGRWSARRSHPRGRTGTARSAGEGGEERSASGLALASGPHLTQDPQFWISS